MKERNQVDEGDYGPRNIRGGPSWSFVEEARNIKLEVWYCIPAHKGH